MVAVGVPIGEYPRGGPFSARIAQNRRAERPDHAEEQLMTTDDAWSILEHASNYIASMPADVEAAFDTLRVHGVDVFVPVDEYRPDPTSDPVWLWLNTIASDPVPTYAEAEDQITTR